MIIQNIVSRIHSNIYHIRFFLVQGADEGDEALNTIDSNSITIPLSPIDWLSKIAGINAAIHAPADVNATAAALADAPQPNICMGELGCFPITPDFIHPKHRPINFTPWPRDKIKTKLLLFTKQNKHEAYQMFAWNHKNLALSPFNRSEPIKMVSNFNYCH